MAPKPAKKIFPFVSKISEFFGQNFEFFLKKKIIKKKSLRKILQRAQICIKYGPMGLVLFSELE